jgi:hypothetical protein
VPLVCLREGGWYVTPRPRHERGDNSSGASLLVLLVLGISISLGLNVLVVLATEAAMSTDSGPGMKGAKDSLPSSREGIDGIQYNQLNVKTRC